MENCFELNRGLLRPILKSSVNTMISAEELVGEEWAEWYSMTPMERWRESAKLWEVYLSLGAQLIPNPIHKAPSSIQRNRVRVLLTGGESCGLCGGTAFAHLN